MAQAKVELVGCKSYSWKQFNFRKNKPQLIHGEENIKYFLGNSEFSVKRISDPKNVVKKYTPTVKPIAPTVPIPKEEVKVEAKVEEEKPVEKKPKRRGRKKKIVDK